MNLQSILLQHFLKQLSAAALLLMATPTILSADGQQQTWGIAPTSLRILEQPSTTYYPWRAASGDLNPINLPLCFDDIGSYSSVTYCCATFEDWGELHLGLTTNPSQPPALDNLQGVICLKVSL